MIKNNKKGMTLVETLVYLAIFAIFFTSVIGFTISISEYNRRSEYRNDLEKSTIFVSEHLNTSINQSLSVDATNSIFQNNNGKLSLNITGGTIEYSIVNSRLNIKRGTENFFLTPSNFSVTQLYVEKVLDKTNNTIGVKVTLIEVSNKYSSINKTITLLLLI